MRIKIAFVQLLPGIDLDENLDIGSTIQSHLS